MPLSNGWHEAWTAPVIDRYSSGRPWAWGMLNKRRLRNWSLVSLQSSVVHEMLLSVELYGRMTVNFPVAGYFPENVHCRRERILRIDCSRTLPFSELISSLFCDQFWRFMCHSKANKIIFHFVTDSLLGFIEQNGLFCSSKTISDFFYCQKKYNSF